MQHITAVIITLNEERNIGRCLQSLIDVADHVVVVDSGSTDATETICRQFIESHTGWLTFLYHAWEGYAGQKNYANSMVSDGWLLSIDADEALSEPLRQQLIQHKQQGFAQDTAYSLCRLNNYCGHWLHHGGWYPDEAVRLWPAGTAVWDGVVHETLTFKRPLHQQRMVGDLLHYTYYSVEEHAQRTMKYAILAAEKAHQQGKRASRSAIVFKPLWTFVNKYVMRLGFLDGMAGYVACRLSAEYTLLKYSRLYELNHQ